ncbi:replicative DNA helicase [Meiothermus ruber]|uniref:Replicative DNA helicase n=1 Tax=Meiothermus ruber (strain ATCC 35948 / DSM 1279 / VKM B-1258 / 21) TaxID=504728 RepID=D3PN10_MEIRD|nr:replicative DNA helicase [Meiothermus ruber]ADD29337.1 replicative DNA helicase [Meiothermus ruber DSM 1279]AGK05213.1 replicative DNA helicase [Meiothermus ruber DSM 1279]MCX7801524.1 replicative DNA helicase [Meiothermus ruber]
MATTPLEGRVPPHNLDAEASVLGSVLLDSEVLDRLEGLLAADAFYKEAHRKIWEAMVALRARRDPVDLVTLSEELRQNGELENVGGLSYLVGLSEQTPTAAYADYYGRIVAEKWTLRKLIAAAGEAMKMAYDEEGSLEDILDTAGRKVLEVSTQGARSEFQSMKELVHETFEHIQMLYENKGQVDGVKSGFRELDSMIGGLTSGSLNIIAARPSMGKTSFALTIAQNVALRGEGAAVAIFSLEMPAVQLVTRMLCSEARIDMNRLRQGQLTDRDFSRLVDVAGRISEAAILIDDTSDLTLMELRARARRLHAQHRLGLIVIDYLQLMSGPGGGKNGGENRQQEIAQISRGLKGLARELDVPVIALSQLSRAVESRPNKRPMLSDLRESGCLTGDSLVQMADGSRQPIRGLVGKSGFAVLALDEATQKLVPARVSRAFSTGVKPVFTLTTRLGRSIRATANHKFLTARGWKRLDELTVGDYLALPRRLASPQQQSLGDEELALLGHLIGDGCTLPRHSLQYTTRDPDLAQTVVDLARVVFGESIAPKIKSERGWLQVYLSAAHRLGWGKRNPVAVWLEGLGVWGLRSHEKRIPRQVFAQPAPAVARFLRHLWSTDGCVALRQGKAPYPAVYYASSSEGLAQDVQTLLLYLGINARLKRVPQKGKGRDQFHVVLSGQSDLLRFVREVGAVGRSKQSALAVVEAYLTGRQENTNRDVIPLELWLQPARASLAVIGMSHRELHRALGMAYSGATLFGQNLSRERTRRMAGALGSEALERLADSDIYWDTVRSIEAAGQEEVFDLTVPGPHNFIANNIIVHNSIEQDADLVMFIYRDEYYNPHSEKAGIAEIIVGKQRNGPTGTVELQFHAQHVRFNDLAKDEI